MQFHLENMTCGGCARNVTKVIQTIDPQAEVITDPPSRLVQVQSSASEERLLAALRDAGYRLGSS